MPIQFDAHTAVCLGNCTVEEAEILLQWRQQQPDGQVDLQDCTHLHTAVLQVLLATQTPVVALPLDAEFAALLRPLLSAPP